MMNNNSDRDYRFFQGNCDNFGNRGQMQRDLIRDNVDFRNMDRFGGPVTNNIIFKNQSDVDYRSGPRMHAGGPPFDRPGHRQSDSNSERGLNPNFREHNSNFPHSNRDNDRGGGRNPSPPLLQGSNFDRLPPPHMSIFSQPPPVIPRSFNQPPPFQSREFNDSSNRPMNADFTQPPPNRTNFNHGVEPLQHRNVFNQGEEFNRNQFGNSEYNPDRRFESQRYTNPSPPPQQDEPMEVDYAEAPQDFKRISPWLGGGVDVVDSRGVEPFKNLSPTQSAVPVQTPEEPPNKTVILRGLPATIGENEIRDELRMCRLSHKDIRVPKKKAGMSRGFAFVEFDTIEEATRFMDITQGVLDFRGTCQVHLAYSIRKDEPQPQESQKVIVPTPYVPLQPEPTLLYMDHLRPAPALDNNFAVNRATGEDANFNSGVMVGDTRFDGYEPFERRQSFDGQQTANDYLETQAAIEGSRHDYSDRRSLERPPLKSDEIYSRRMDTKQSRNRSPPTRDRRSPALYTHNNRDENSMYTRRERPKSQDKSTDREHRPRSSDRDRRRSPERDRRRSPERDRRRSPERDRRSPERERRISRERDRRRSRERDDVRRRSDRDRSKSRDRDGKTGGRLDKPSARGRFNDRDGEKNAKQTRQPIDNIPDWKCGKCNSTNFKRRTTCFRCDLPRSACESSENDPKVKEFDGYAESSIIPGTTLLFFNLDVFTEEESVSHALAILTSMPIKKVRLMKDNQSNISRGFCQVELNTIQEARCLHTLLTIDPNRPLNVDGRNVICTYMRDRNRKDGSKNAATVALAAAQWTNQQVPGESQPKRWDPTDPYSAALNSQIASAGLTVPTDPGQYGKWYEDLALQYLQAGYDRASYDAYFQYAYQSIYQNMLATGTLPEQLFPQGAQFGNLQPKPVPTGVLPVTDVSQSGSVLERLGKPMANGDWEIFEVPDLSKYTFDANSGYYYDASLGLYYDPNTHYYYNGVSKQYLYWDGSKRSYLPVPPDGEGAASAGGKEEPTGKVKDKEEKVKIAKKIQKDMERWAKSQNQKTAKANPVPAGPNPAPEQRSVGAADAGYAALTNRQSTPSAPASQFASVAIGRGGKPGSNPSAKLNPSGLVAAYGDDSDDEPEDNINTKAQPGKTTASGSGLAACDAYETRLTDWSKLACLLCKRAFPSKEGLIRHQQVSDLHKQNLEINRRSRLSVAELEELERRELEIKFKGTQGNGDAQPAAHKRRF